MSETCYCINVVAFLHHVINETDVDTTHIFYAFSPQLINLIEMCCLMISNNRMQRVEVKYLHTFAAIFRFHPQFAIEYQV